jgi:hypothetical protein
MLDLPALTTVVSPEPDGISPFPSLIQTETGLSVLFYDLTAFVVHGSYPGSRHIDFGFANNTP